MCSIGEDDFGDEGGTHAMIPATEADQALENNIGVCKRCGKTEVTVYKVYLRGFECQECFLASTRHKFRATLGSSKILPRDADVLLAFDGTAESVVLLDMMHYAQSQNNFKRLHCRLKIVYIDETVFLNSQQEERKQYRPKTIEIFKENLKNYELFESYIVPLSNRQNIQLLSTVDVGKYLEEHKSSDEEFLSRIDAFKSLTSRQDYLKQHKDRTLAYVAEQLKCPFVFSAEISNTLSAKLLTSIIMGRGGSAALDVSLVDERHNVKFIRPLRDINHPEMQLYMRIQNLRPLLEHANDFYGCDKGARSSLQNLTKSFVDNLQEKFPSTISTVFRTGEKMAPNRDVSQQLKEITLSEAKLPASSCHFCQSRLDEKPFPTLLAIELSKVVSQTTDIPLHDTERLCESAETRLQDLCSNRRLCHACQNIEDDCTRDGSSLLEM